MRGEGCKGGKEGQGEKGDIGNGGWRGRPGVIRDGDTANSEVESDAEADIVAEPSRKKRVGPHSARKKVEGTSAASAHAQSMFYLGENQGRQANGHIV